MRQTNLKVRYVANLFLFLTKKSFKVGYCVEKGLKMVICRYSFLIPIKKWTFVMMKLKLVSKIGKLIVLHTSFWIAVWWFFIYFFSFNSSNTSYVHWFSNVLLPIAILNTYFTNYYLIPKYLIPKKHKYFISYQIYTIIFTAYFLSIVMFVGYVFLTPLDFKQMPLLSKSLPFILLIIYTVVLVVSSANIMRYNYKALEQNKILEK